MSATSRSSASVSVFSSSSSPSPSSSPQSSGGGGTPVGFYRNLFYILIGLLCAFGLVSFLSLLRARRRRMAIFREASRLGVLVPGLPGYVPVRERSTMTWFRVDGSDRPEFWDVLREEKKTNPVEEEEAVQLVSSSSPTSALQFKPLGVIPPPEKISREPPPASPLSYFPNHLAYRPESLVPPPSRFKADNPESLDGLNGETVEVLTIIQMPKEPWAEGREVQEEEEVIKEWSNIELGVLHMDVGRGSDGMSRNV